MAMNHLMDEHYKKDKQMDYLSWKHMGWNPKVDGIMLLIAKSKKWHFLIGWRDACEH